MLNRYFNDLRNVGEKPQCTVDNDCLQSEVCVSQVCRDPCAVQNPCGTSAICRASNHRPLCVCPQGWAGNPQVRCYRRKLKKLNEICFGK